MQSRRFSLSSPPSCDGPLNLSSSVSIDTTTAYRLEVHRTGYQADDAYSSYIEMRSPKELSAAQIAHLQELTQDLPETEKAVRSGSDGTVAFSIPMKGNDVVLIKVTHDRGNK
jgi:xylan 1,4-beta-xylosidase